jgi:hypothetical protein
MVIAAGRAYKDLIRWLKEARPPRMNPWRLARRLFWNCILVATVILGTIAAVAPSRYGASSGGVGRSPESWAVVALVAICIATVFLRRSDTGSPTAWFRETISGGLEQHPSFEPATNALEACPAALRTRFAMGWVWGPLAMMILGAIFAASSSYFLIDAILARFTVGWQQVALAVINALLGLAVLRLAAKRLSVWRLSLALHRSASA